MSEKQALIESILKNLSNVHKCGDSDITAKCGDSDITEKCSDDDISSNCGD